LERIQYAIAKARAEREAQAGAQGQVAPPPPPAGGLRRAAAEAPPANGAAPQHTPIGDAAARAAAAAATFMGTARSEEEIAAAWRDLAALHVTKRHAVRNRLVSLVGGTGAAEMDGIRTRLLQQAAAKGLRRIAITSPTPGCGKTTVAINLGFSLGRLPEQRTIVADLDLRRPSLHKALGVKEKHSFARVLQNEADFADNALRHGQTLDFATTHETTRNPAELLQSRRAAQTIAAIEARYAPTIMLFDLPPLLVNDDAMAFLGHVDAALIVAAAGRTTIKEIDRAEREVASQTKVLGVILNSCRYMDGTDGYGDYYG
jgi:Mrp family chromosome partitioning ATPase